MVAGSGGGRVDRGVLAPGTGIDRAVRRRLGERPRPIPPLAVGLTGSVLLGLVLLAGGLALVRLDEAVSVVTSLDRQVTAWFVRHRTSWLTTGANAASALTDTPSVLGLVVGAGSMLALLRCWRRLAVLLVSVLVELATYVSVTFLVARPRPDVALGMVPVTGSYPSGHAAMGVALYGALAVIVVSLLPRPLVPTAAATTTVLVVVAVSLSRLYLGLHYLSDVVVGVLLGLAALVVAVVAARSLPAQGAEADDDGQRARGAAGATGRAA